MSSIARQYIHISYTDVLSNVFIVTNFTLNIFFNHLLFLTNNSHVTLSSQCIRSHSIKKYIPVLSCVQLPFNMCVLKCALYFVHRISIQSGFMQSYDKYVWHLNSTLFFFLFQKKWLGNKDVSLTTGKNVRHVSRWGQIEAQCFVFFFFPCCGVTAQTWQPGHDHTERQQKYTQKNLNTAHSESTKVQYKCGFPTKSINKNRSCIYRRLTERVERRGRVV